MPQAKADESASIASPREPATGQRFAPCLCSMDNGQPKFVYKGYTLSLWPMSWIRFADCCRYESSRSGSIPHRRDGVFSSCSRVKNHFDEDPRHAAIALQCSAGHAECGRDVGRAHGSASSGIDWPVNLTWL